MSLLFSITASRRRDFFSPVSLFSSGENGGYYLPSDASTLFQSSAGTTPAADGDPVGYMGDKSGNVRHAIQATSGNRPTRSSRKISFLSGKSLVASFGGSLGTSNVTIVTSIPGVGVDYRYGQTVGTTYSITGDCAAVLIINRALTALEEANVRALFYNLATMGGTLGTDRDLFDATKPQAFFIEGWAANSLVGVTGDAPNNASIPKGDTENDIVLEYTVTGIAGSSSLAISAGDESYFTNKYGAVLQHDDGTWGFHQVMGLSGGVCSVFPPLRANATAKVLRNTGSAVSGQHMTRPATRALVDRIFRCSRGDGYRRKYATQWLPYRGNKSDWSVAGGFSAPHYNVLELNNFVGAGTYANLWSSRDRSVMRAQYFVAPYTGKGLQKSFSGLGGASGFVETFISSYSTTDVASTRVQLAINGVGVYDQIINGGLGLQRLRIPYTAANTAVLTITRSDEISVDLFIGGVTFWAYDRSQDWTAPIINKNGKIVIIGDSWTRWSSSAFSDELTALISAAGGTGTVVNVGLGGQNVEWGLANFNTLVVPENPTQVIILFFTNDKNQWSRDNVNRWLGGMYELGRRCQAIGAEPIFVMPLPTQSVAQSSDHGQWAARFGLGIPV